MSSFRRPLYRTKEVSSIVQNVREHYFPPEKQSSTASKDKSKVKRGDGGLTMDEAMNKLGEYCSPTSSSHQQETQISLNQTADMRAIILNLACNLPKEHSNGIRSVVNLPNPVPQDLRILVFAPPNLSEVLRESGATIVGGSELIDPIIEGKIEFDRCLASTDMMPVIAKLGRFLGQKGMVPTIKTGNIDNTKDDLI